MVEGLSLYPVGLSQAYAPVSCFRIAAGAAQLSMAEEDALRPINRT